jgi:signal transduction histidine kinase
VSVDLDGGRGPGDDVVAVVTDDGRGLPAVPARSGLANLEERARRRGGRLTVTGGGPQGGTTVTWRAPRRDGA